MGKIKLNTAELEALQTRFGDIIAKTQSISNGGYVSNNLFSESKGSSSTAMENLLGVLVNSANQMENIVMKTDIYLGEIIEGFTVTDWENANKMGER